MRSSPTSRSFEAVKKVFDEHNMKYQEAQIEMIPQTSVKLEGKSAETMLKLMEALEDSDDVQDVHANFDISLQEMERLSSNWGSAPPPWRALYRSSARSQASMVPR